MRTHHLRARVTLLIITSVFISVFTAGVTVQASVSTEDCSAGADINEVVFSPEQLNRKSFEKVLFLSLTGEDSSSPNYIGLSGGLGDGFNEGQSIGFYSNGKIQSSVQIGPTDEFLLKLFQLRNRGWGTTELTGILTQVALSMKLSFPDGERLQVGDISQKAGGRITRHASHQNGLDVDMGYFRLNRREQNPEDENGFDESFVRNGLITSNFDVDRNWNLAKNLVSSGKVGRIFMDGAIKKIFCDYTSRFRSNEIVVETLRRIRPYSDHADHLHLRFKCQASDTDCVAQAEPPLGDGCKDLY